jgi:predicted small secreted protein
MNVALHDLSIVMIKESNMKNFRLAITLAALVGAAPLLSACHTTAGVGQDVSQGGHALTNSANANAPSSPHP